MGYLDYLMLLLPVVAGIFTGYKIIRRDRLPVDIPCSSLYSLARERMKPARQDKPQVSEACFQGSHYYTEPAPAPSADHPK